MDWRLVVGDRESEGSGRWWSRLRGGGVLPQLFEGIEQAARQSRSNHAVRAAANQVAELSYTYTERHKATDRLPTKAAVTSLKIAAIDLPQKLELPSLQQATERLDAEARLLSLMKATKRFTTNFNF